MNTKIYYKKVSTKKIENATNIQLLDKRKKFSIQGFWTSKKKDFMGHPSKGYI